MKKMYKAMALVLCAILLVVGSVMGTLAYLQAQTKTVTNTFTVGNVSITLKEYGIKADGTIDKDTVYDVTAEAKTVENIKLVPGRTIYKNPFITVADNSEDCYLFVEIVNGLSGNVTINMTDGWTQIAESNYWMYETKVSENTTVNVFETVTCSTGITNDTATGSITITAYAVQAEGFTDNNSSGTAADEAWTATFNK